MNVLNNIEFDKEYLNIVKDILENPKFLKIKECIHHGTSRFEHSLRVSYYSYKIAKKLKLNYKETARGGLLHDFFENTDLTPKKKRLSMFFHPYKAVINAKDNFNITRLEEDIIINHMFPTLPHKIPKNAESWIVSMVDKGIATYEFYDAYGKTYLYRHSHLYIILLLILHW